MFCQRPFSLKVQETQGNKSEENCKTTGFSFLFSQNSGHHNSSPKLSKTWSFRTIQIHPKVKDWRPWFSRHTPNWSFCFVVGLTRFVPIKFNPKCFLHHFWMGHCPGLCRGVAKVVGGDVREKTSSLLLVPFDGFISGFIRYFGVKHIFFGRFLGVATIFMVGCLYVFLIYARIWICIHVRVYAGQLVLSNVRGRKRESLDPKVSHPEKCAS